MPRILIVDGDNSLILPRIEVFPVTLRYIARPALYPFESCAIAFALYVFMVLFHIVVGLFTILRMDKATSFTLPHVNLILALGIAFTLVRRKHTLKITTLNIPPLQAAGVSTVAAIEGIK